MLAKPPETSWLIALAMCKGMLLSSVITTVVFGRNIIFTEIMVGVETGCHTIVGVMTIVA